MFSVRQVLDQRRGIAPGFGLMRHVLSALILINHCYVISLGKTFNVGYQKNDLIGQFRHLGGKQLLIESFRPFMFYLVGAFFVLSGFLVFGSALRNRNLKDFFMLRVIRIVPALAVEVTISALIIGPLVTSWALADYFQDSQFWSYFANIVGIIHYDLPGVFKTNPTPNWVNLNLWTLPSELECYLILGSLMLLGITRSRRTMLAVVVVATLIILWLSHAGMLDLHRGNVSYSARYIVYLFFLGILAYMFAEFIPLSFGFLVACVALFYLGAIFHVPDVLFAPCLVYTVVYIGCLDFSKFDAWIGGDYSYGIYLYGFPLTQMVVYYLKGWLGSLPAALQVVTVAAIALPLTCIVAFLSWHLIERRCLKLKRFFIQRKAVAPVAVAPGQFAGTPESQSLVS